MRGAWARLVHQRHCSAKSGRKRDLIESGRMRDLTELRVWLVHYSSINSGGMCRRSAWIEDYPFRRTTLTSNLLLGTAKDSDAIGARRSRVQCAVLLSHPTHILPADIDVTATKSAPDEVRCNALQLRLMLHTAQCQYARYAVGRIASARRSRVQCATAKAHATQSSASQLRGESDRERPTKSGAMRYSSNSCCT